MTHCPTTACRRPRQRSRPGARRSRSCRSTVDRKTATRRSACRRPGSAAVGGHSPQALLCVAEPRQAVPVAGFTGSDVEHLIGCSRPVCSQQTSRVHYWSWWQGLVNVGAAPVALVLRNTPPSLTAVVPFIPPPAHPDWQDREHHVVDIAVAGARSIKSACRRCRTDGQLGTLTDAGAPLAPLRRYSRASPAAAIVPPPGGHRRPCRSRHQPCPRRAGRDWSGAPGCERWTGR